MKTIYISVWLVLLNLGLYGQEKERISLYDRDTTELKTLFKGVNSHGGFGSVYNGYTRLHRNEALVLGTHAAWIINHCFALGGAGYGFFNEARPNNLLEEYYKYRLSGGYGGLLLEGIIFPKNPFHLAFPLVIGGGRVTYTKQFIDNWNNNKTNETYTLDSDAFFVAEAGVEIELNLVNHFRLCFGSYYRYASNITLKTISPTTSEIVQLAEKDALRGFTFNISLKVGKF